jgi:hypothetical protein
VCDVVGNIKNEIGVVAPDWLWLLLPGESNRTKIAGTSKVNLT